jgi:thiol-disulfide isomerase/thioredoxin
MRRLVVLLIVALAACRSGSARSLPQGSAAPDFALPGVDGNIHRLSDYASSPILAVVFTCNHCAASELYERRIERLYEDYRTKGVAVVAINPNNPDAVSVRDLGYTDVGDGLPDMKARAAHRHLDYPYLYDGETQATAKAFAVVAMPQIFVFDRDRKLQYEGRIDDNVREPLVKSHDAREAIDALVAGRPVRTAHTDVEGCAPVWRAPGKSTAEAKNAAVGVEMATPEVLKKLRGNGTSKLLLVNFWATWCGPCAVEFPDLVETSRMYGGRSLEFVSVSVNQPEEKAMVLEFLQKHQASNRNLLFATPNTYDLQAAFDPAMPSAVPFTLVIAPNGDVVYQELGSLDILKLRRAILSNLADDRDNPGVQAYWAAD